MARVKVIKVPETVQVPPGNITGPEWTEERARTERVRTRVYDVRDFGAIGDGVTDDTAALQACADAARTGNGEFFLPKGLDCRITSPLNLRYVQDVTIRGRVTVVHTEGPGVIVGNRSTGAIPTAAYIAEVVYADIPIQTNPLIRVIGSKMGVYTIVSCRYLQLYANHADPADDSIAYSNFYLGFIRKLELFGEPGGQSWINSNKFFGGRLFSLILTAEDYHHNHNRFYGPELEAGSTIQFNCGWYNKIVDMRGEGSTNTAFFNAGTYRNTVEQSWGPNESELHPRIAVTDLGFGNAVFNTKQRDAAFRTIVRIDSASLTTNAASAWNVPHATRRILPGFRKLSIANTSTQYLDTGIFPVESVYPAPSAEGGAVMRDFRIQSDAALWRFKVHVYDANRQPLDGASTAYIQSAGMWSWNAGGFYGVSSNTRGGRITVTHPDVKYIRVLVESGTTTGAFTSLELLGYVPVPSGDQLVEQVRKQIVRPLAQINSTPPTKSMLPHGTTISTNGGLLIVTHRVDTTVAAGSPSGASTITVASGAGISTGDNIAILLNNDATHLTTVSSVSGSTIGVADPLPFAVGPGNDVATNRFSHIT